MLARGESRTDWAAAKAMMEEELDASITADPDDAHEPIDWTQAMEGMPPSRSAPGRARPLKGLDTR